jgi:nitric oxide synthase-interacting protein
MQDPVVGPSGHIFSREAILENLLAQKKANKRKLKAWEAQQQEEQRKVGERQRGS